MSWFFVTRIITNRSCICYIACADVKLSWIWWSIRTFLQLSIWGNCKLKCSVGSFAERLGSCTSAQQTHKHTHASPTHTHTHTHLLAAAVYPSPALQRKPSSWGWEGWHCRGSASPPHDLHVAQPLKYCSLWREAKSQSSLSSLLSSSPAPPLCFLCLCPSTSFSATHRLTQRKKTYWIATYLQEALCQFVPPHPPTQQLFLLNPPHLY